ncbi:MAG: hypothetical protein ABS888_01760, partial [Eubacteriales bacterium]
LLRNMLLCIKAIITNSSTSTQLFIAYSYCSSAGFNVQTQGGYIQTQGYIVKRKEPMAKRKKAPAFDY